ncbi:MAG: hypothetical protein MJA27_18200 [Pseudanabaenales cyanobacterium]|nr:hypothetical protein [Pseudanabaenales cyanobacterium]
MKNTIHLWREEAVKVGGTVTTNLTIEGYDQSRTNLWYRVPAEYAAQITSSMDPFVIATLFLAMKRGANLHVNGEVSPSLLHNLEEFQAIWSCWKPEVYKKIKITAELEREQPKAEDSAGDIVAFSGGVDSCFTAFRHTAQKCGRLNRQIKAAVMFHGFDIPLERQDVFDWSCESSKRMLDSLGIKLIPMATNFSTLRLLMNDVFGAAAASCLMLFQGIYRAGLFASSEPYQALVSPWGTHPLTDRLLSSNSFEIIHDGADFTRTQKTAQLCEWPEALSRLRVCWYGPQNDPENRGRNCGRCEKCIRTILNFRVAGIDLPECFEQDVSDTQILGLRRLNGTQINEFEQIYLAAEKASISESWVKAVRFCILRNRLEAPLIEKWRPIKHSLRQLLSRR